MSNHWSRSWWGFALGTLANAVIFTAAAIWTINLPDDDTSGEGLATILFALFVCEVVVGVSAGVQGWLRLSVGRIVLRWVFVSLVLAVASVVTGSFIPMSLADTVVEVLVSLGVSIALLVPAALVGGILGREIPRRRDHQRITRPAA